MKTKVMVTLICLMTMGVIAKADAGDESPEHSQKLLLTLVIDASPTDPSTWKRIHTLACQATAKLNPGDRLQILKARCGKPQILISTISESSHRKVENNIYRWLGDIDQTFIFRADVDKAMTAAFDDMDRYAGNFKCCLLILSDGKLDDGKAKRIRRAATLCKTRNWPLCITVTKNANRQLFIAGSLGELQISMLDEIDLADWLSEVRISDAKTPVTHQEPAQPPSAAITGSSELPAQVRSSSSQSICNASPEALKNIPGNGRTDENTLRFLLPVYSVPINSDRSDTVEPKASTGNHETPTPVLESSETTKETADDPAPSSRRKLPLAMIAGGLIAVLLLTILVFWFKDASSTRKAHRQIRQYADDDKDRDYRLIATSDGQRFDLGSEHSIRDLVIGQNPGSAIPLNNSSVKDRHFRLFRKKGRLKIQNLTGEPLLVNNLSVNKGQKHDILLPASLQLAKDLKIYLSREEATEKTNQNNGGEDHV